MLNKKSIEKIDFEDIRNLLKDLCQMQYEIFKGNFVGLYLYGSLVWGDFDYETSDIDLLTVIKEDVTKKELTELKEMHKKLDTKYPEWQGRIEVQYNSVSGLQNFRTKTNQMVNISPGEPIHFIPGDKDWLMNWYFVQEYSLVLSGPDAKEVIPNISKEEFINEVKRFAMLWKREIAKTQKDIPYQSYAILTMCRAYYTFKNGKQVSKQKAAEWVKSKFPEWSNKIDWALYWRINNKSVNIDPTSTYPETVNFVNEFANKIQKGS